MACTAMELPRKVEELGTVFATELINPPGVDPPRLIGLDFFPGPEIVPAEGREELRGILRGGESFKVLRETYYTFDSEDTECVFIFKFRVCQYQQVYEIKVNGNTIFRQEAKGLERRRTELIGVCPEKVIEFLVGAGSKAIPTPAGLFSLADTSAAPQGFDVAVAGLLGPLLGQITPTAETTTGPRISLAAASTILRRVDLDAGELTSLQGGGARLSDVAAELEALGNERGRAAAAVLRNLERSPIRLGDGVSEDEAFISVVATLLASRLSA
jgi:hypothetical protein